MLRKRLLYPGLMAAAFVGYWALLHFGVPLVLAPYVTIALFGPLVLVAERMLPFRPDWLPATRDFAIDGVYMLLVQIAIPFALAWGLYWLIQAALLDAGLVWTSGQPSLPIWVAAPPQDHDRRLPPLLAAPRRPHLDAALAAARRPSRAGEALHHQRLPLPSGREGAAVPARYAALHAGRHRDGSARRLFRLLFDERPVPALELRRPPWLAQLRGQRPGGAPLAPFEVKIAESNANYAHSFVGWDLLFGTYFRPRWPERRSPRA